MKLSAYFDGACEPINPGGHAACGAVVKEGDEIRFQGSRYLGHGPAFSNNLAEYEGLVLALEWLYNSGRAGDRVEVYGDSRLVIKQMQGAWGVKGGLYVSAYRRARQLADDLLAHRLMRLTFHHILRTLNEEADALSTAPLTERGIHERVKRWRP